MEELFDKADFNETR